MKAIPFSELPEVLLIEPRVFRDGRGYFLETYHEDRYEQAGIPRLLVQANQSSSVPGVLRGLHYQWPAPQGKLVRVLHGRVWDVAVDIRVDSPTFGVSVSAELSGDNFRQLWIPPGFAHGFAVLGDVPATLAYLCTEAYNPAYDRAVRWDDPDLAVRWPLSSPLLSDKDRGAPLLADLRRANLLPIGLS